MPVMDFLLRPNSMAVIFLIIVFSILIFRRLAGKFDRKRYHPVGSTIFNQLMNFNRLHDYMTDLASKYKTYRLITPFRSEVYTSDPANVEYILKTKFENYGKGWHNYSILKDLLGDGIFTVDGRKWREQRKVSSLEFSARALRDVSSIVFRENAVKLANIVSEAVASNQPMDIQALFMKSTLDSIFRVAFGFDLDSVCGSNEEGARFSRAFDDASEFTAWRYVDVLWKIKKVLNVGLEAKLKENIRVVDEFVYKLIHSKIEQMQKLPDDCVHLKKEDILSRFLKLSEADPKYLRDIILNFIMAGKDTTATTLSWFFYMMCKHPLLQDKAGQEIVEATASKGVVNMSEFAASLREEALEKMHYLHAALTETLRLYPPVPVDPKMCFSDDTMPDGFHVKKGDVVAYQPLNVEKLSIGDIQRLEWETLETKIRRWIRAAKICVRVLFASERRLCEQIFEGLGTAADDACFMETIKGPAIQLFNFAEAISISRRSPEKLFKILDLHDALSDLLPDIESVFESKSSESIRVQAVEILSRLAEAARGILSEFENAVLREPSRVPVPGGTIHPLTRYVMNYISLISDYKQTLIELIVSRPSTGPRYSSDPNVPDMDFSEFEGQSSTLALHLIWIIVILQFNLDGKSKHYKDASLAHLFMMNNVHYIVQKIKGSPELREMIGDDYLKKLTGKFRFSATNYQRATWVRVLYCLRDEGLHVSGSFSSGVSKSALRERFKAFNAMFEEVHRTQATWLIPDTQLREELRISISEKLIPAYRSFLGRFRSHIESGRHPENYIKYSVEDLESAVLDFFEGYPVSQHLRRRSQ